MTTANGAAEARKVVFATPDPEPDLPAELKRQPRPGELKYDYLVTIAREVGIIAGDASLDAEQKRRYSLEMLELAEQDSVFGGSRSGRAIQQASALWEQRNPKLAAELGKLSERSRDLSGRAVAGPARAVALLLETLAEDVTTNLTPAEAELMRSLVPGVIEAIEKRERGIAELQEAVLVAVNAGQIDHPPGQPGVPIQRSEVAPS